MIHHIINVIIFFAILYMFYQYRNFLPIATPAVLTFKKEPYLPKKTNMGGISASSVRPSASPSTKIWNSTDDQTETWPYELTREDLVIEPFLAKKSVGFR